MHGYFVRNISAPDILVGRSLFIGEGLRTGVLVAGGQKREDLSRRICVFVVVLDPNSTPLFSIVFVLDRCNRSEQHAVVLVLVVVLDRFCCFVVCRYCLFLLAQFKCRRFFVRLRTQQQ